MTKTQEELNKLKEEFETINSKFKELTEDELNIVVGGNDINRDLDITPNESGTGTTSNENVIPHEVNPK